MRVEEALLHRRITCADGQDNQDGMGSTPQAWPQGQHSSPRGLAAAGSSPRALGGMTYEPCKAYLESTSEEQQCLQGSPPLCSVEDANAAHEGDAAGPMRATFNGWLQGAEDDPDFQTRCVLPLRRPPGASRSGAARRMEEDEDEPAGEIPGAAEDAAPADQAHAAPDAGCARSSPSRPRAEARNPMSAEAQVEAFMRIILEGRTAEWAAQNPQLCDSASSADEAEISSVALGSPGDEDSGFMYSGMVAGCDASRRKKHSFIPRIFRSTRRSAAHFVSSMMNDHIMMHDEIWYGHQLSSLSTEGMECTKVARNGRLLQRSVHITADCASATTTVEIRGGRNGPKAVRLDELIDIRRGLSGGAFNFLHRFRKDSPHVLDERAVELLSPSRTFSLIFSSSDLRDTLAHCILYVLRPNESDVGGGRLTWREGVSAKE